MLDEQAYDIMIFLKNANILKFIAIFTFPQLCIFSAFGAGICKAVTGMRIKVSNDFNGYIFLGRCECARPSHSQHFQRAPRVPHLLAHLRNHGRPNVRGKVLQGKISIIDDFCIKMILSRFFLNILSARLFWYIQPLCLGFFFGHKVKEVKILKPYIHTTQVTRLLVKQKAMDQFAKTPETLLKGKRP